MSERGRVNTHVGNRRGEKNSDGELEEDKGISLEPGDQNSVPNPAKWQDAAFKELL